MMGRAGRRLRLARFWLGRGDLDEAAKHAYRALPGPPELAAEVALTIARIERDRDCPEASRTHLERALTALDARWAVGTTPESGTEPCGASPHVRPGRVDRDCERLMVRALVDLADCHRRAGRCAQAGPLLRRALALCGHDDSAVLNMLGIVAKELGAFDEADDWYGQAAAVQDRHDTPAGSRAALQHNLAGLALARHHSLAGHDLARGRDVAPESKLAREHAEEAEVRARRAVELRRSDRRSTAVDVAADLAVLAAAVAAQDRHDEARALFAETLAACTAARPPRRYEIAVHLHNLAAIEQAVGHPHQAEQRYRQTLAMKEELLGDDHPEVALVLNNLGTLLAEQDRPDEADGCYRRALAIAERHLPHDHPTLDGIRQNLAAR